MTCVQLRSFECRRLRPSCVMEFQEERIMIIRPGVALAAMIVAAASGSPAFGKSPMTAAGSGTIRYCATVTINSRVTRKVCLTEQEWLNHGVKLHYYLPSI